MYYHRTHAFRYRKVDRWVDGVIFEQTTRRHVKAMGANCRNSYHSHAINGELIIRHLCRNTKKTFSLLRFGETFYTQTLFPQMRYDVFQRIESTMETSIFHASSFNFRHLLRRRVSTTAWWSATLWMWKRRSTRPILSVLRWWRLNRLCGRILSAWWAILEFSRRPTFRRLCSSDWWHPKVCRLSSGDKWRRSVREMSCILWLEHLASFRWDWSWSYSQPWLRDRTSTARFEAGAPWWMSSSKRASGSGNFPNEKR